MCNVMFITRPWVHVQNCLFLISGKMPISAPIPVPQIGSGHRYWKPIFIGSKNHTLYVKTTSEGINTQCRRALWSTCPPCSLIWDYISYVESFKQTQVEWRTYWSEKLSFASHLLSGVSLRYDRAALLARELLMCSSIGPKCCKSLMDFCWR